MAFVQHVEEQQTREQRFQANEELYYAFDKVADEAGRRFTGLYFGNWMGIGFLTSLITDLVDIERRLDQGETVSAEELEPGMRQLWRECGQSPTLYKQLLGALKRDGKFPRVQKHFGFLRPKVA